MLKHSLHRQGHTLLIRGEHRARQHKGGRVIEEPAAAANADKARPIEGTSPADFICTQTRAIKPQPFTDSPHLLTLWNARVQIKEAPLYTSQGSLTFVES